MSKFGRDMSMRFPTFFLYLLSYDDKETTEYS